MAKQPTKTPDILPDENVEQPPVNPTDELAELAEAPNTDIPLDPGFHVFVEGKTLGCYPTLADAEAFAKGHLADREFEIKEL